MPRLLLGWRIGGPGKCKIRGEAGVEGEFAFFGGVLLSLLLFGTKLFLPLPRVSAGLSAGLSWHTRHWLPRRAIACGSRALRGSCHSHSRIIGRGLLCRSLVRFLLSLCSKLVLEVLNVVVGVVLHRGLRWLVLRGSVLRRSRLRVRTENRRKDDESGCSQVHHGLHILLQIDYGITGFLVLLLLRLHGGSRDGWFIHLPAPPFIHCRMTTPCARIPFSSCPVL